MSLQSEVDAVLDQVRREVAELHALTGDDTVIMRVQVADLADDSGHNAHLAVMHGRDVLYVIEERAPGRASLVTDVGVRLPAHLTASGRAILAALPAAQVRALVLGV